MSHSAYVLDSRCTWKQVISQKEQRTYVNVSYVPGHDVHVTKSRTHVYISGVHATSWCTTMVYISYILRATHANNCGAHITPHGAHINHGAHVHESWCAPTIFRVTAASLMVRMCVMVHIPLSPGTHATESLRACSRIVAHIPRVMFHI